MTFKGNTAMGAWIEQRVRRLCRSAAPYAVLALALQVNASTLASAQDSRPSPPYPSATTDQPGSTTFIGEPMTVANVVHTWVVLDVSASGALLVNASGEQRELELWPITIPPQSETAGANARRFLRSLVGRELQFSFHQHNDSGAAGAHQPPSQHAYTDAVASMIQRGLARYCPEAGVDMPQLKRFEQEAKARSVGLWNADAPFSCHG